MNVMATRIPSRQTRNEQVRDRITFWTNLIAHSLAWAFFLGIVALGIAGLNILGQLFAPS